MLPTAGRPCGVKEWEKLETNSNSSGRRAVTQQQPPVSTHDISLFVYHSSIDIPL